MITYPFKKLAKYPHLMPKDVKIWERFIDQNPDSFGLVSYDVRVGEGMKLPDDAEEPYASDMYHLSKKRIDVVGFVGNEAWVIELKPRAGFTAIGQALGLTELYQPEGLLFSIICPCIITDEEMPDIRGLCLKKDIIYLIA